MSDLIRADLSTIRHWRSIMVDPIVVGVIDSGFRVEQAGKVLDAGSFRLGDAGVDTCPAQPDRLGHGSCLLDVVAAHAPAVKFAIAQVFHDRMVTSAVLVAAALDWLAEREVRVINLSLGLRQDRGVLRAACRLRTCCRRRDRPVRLDTGAR
jgi:hypothetical protein